jgi:hypothetical protein
VNEEEEVDVDDGKEEMEGANANAVGNFILSKGMDPSL